ncbi:5305_t:CDS:2 [Gigaspora rosea]|nr:5305_t:CDS:2 [Gigaspora rosea]
MKKQLINIIVATTIALTYAITKRPQLVNPNHLLPYKDGPFRSDNWNGEKDKLLETIAPAINQHAEEIETLQEEVIKLEKINEVEAAN